jgi:hypothetical protein
MERRYSSIAGIFVLKKVECGENLNIIFPFFPGILQKPTQ